MQYSIIAARATLDKTNNDFLHKKLLLGNLDAFYMLVACEKRICDLQESNDPTELLCRS